ncbi:hypothetical protein H0H93_002463 [Arthromyces matolae]|nr:hypothetical protein H0H93_002463 [Arthromyces matolae]
MDPCGRLRPVGIVSAQSDISHNKGDLATKSSIATFTAPLDVAMLDEKKAPYHSLNETTDDAFPPDFDAKTLRITSLPSPESTTSRTSLLLGRWRPSQVTEDYLPSSLSHGATILGFGTFDTDTTDPSLKLNDIANFDSNSEEVLPGSIIRYPKWGIRMRCATLPNTDVNLYVTLDKVQYGHLPFRSVPLSMNNKTYVFTPRPVLESLFSDFGMDYPEASIQPFNITQVVNPGDSVSSSLNTSDIALGGADGKGWISIEEVLVRLNTSYTPNGTFSRKSDQSVPDAQGNPTWIGYDAAVCVELFEPWIVEVYNSTTGLPTTLRIVEAGNLVRSQNTPQLQEELVGLPLVNSDSSVSQQLNSSNLADVYESAHDNSVNQILKTVSYTNGEGPLGYTQLSASYFAQARALADSTNILPYFAGSGQLLARQYSDNVLSNTWINPVYMGAYLSVIFVLGLLAGLFVPKLPLNVPHRGFEIYSWIAAFHAEELMEIGRSSGIGRNLELEEIAQQFGNVKFRHVTTDSHIDSRF